ncbi:MAG: TRAP transporter substrate-binding protein [Pseudoflavonifractor sp.]|nr:TRAP transporter substrate-binding protein [Pseudoflavonifractor sp.]
MNKNFKRLITGTLSLAMTLSLTACGGGQDAPSPSAASSDTGASSAPSGESINIRIASSSPTVEFEGDGTTALGISTNYFVNEISKRTNGRITAQVFPDGQIASSTQEYIGGLQNGAFDMGILNCGSWGDYTSAFAGLNMPYLYFDYDTVYAVLDSEIGESWKEKAEADTGCIPLGYFDIGFRELTCNNEVHSPDDLKGVKIRTMPDPIQTATWEALGCAVTPVAYSELYTALQQKMVDAQENPPSNIVSSKVYELQKYMVITNHNFTATIPAASPLFWNKLSADDQQLIRDVMIEAQNKGREKTAELADGFIKTVENSGNTQVINLTNDELKMFQDKAKTVWPMVEKQMGTDAYNKLLDFVDKYEAGKA